MTDPTRPVVILSTADFHSAVWTNKQHLAVGLARHTDVTYIESLGLRAPTFGRSDLARLANRLHVGGRPGPDETPERVRLISPRVIPFHSSRLARKINTSLIEGIAIPELEDAVLWTFSPLTYGLERRAARVVYHSVDLLHTQPRVPAATLLASERHLLETADAVIASSNGVADHLRRSGRDDVLLWENVANTELFGSAKAERQPRAIFAGNLTSTKINTRLLRSVADEGVPVVLAGPREIDGAAGHDEFDQLTEHPLITYLGNLPPDRLAVEFARSMVGLIPYRLNDYTAGVFPMKVYEYLASGLDVVSTALPSLTEPRFGLTISGPEAFGGVVTDAVARFDADAATARTNSAAAHSWTSRIEQSVELIREL